MSYLCIRKQDPAAGTKGIMCGGVFLPTENYEAEQPTPAAQIPSDGLALYVPLSEAPNASEWAGYGSITYKTVDGVPCANFNGSNSNTLQSSFQFEATEFTVSIVFNARSFTPESGNIPYLFNFGTSNSDSSRLALRLDNYWNKNGLAMVYNGAYLVAQNLSTNKWYSAQIKFDGTEMSLYLDGELQLKQSVSAMTIDDGLFIGRSPNGDNAFNGYLSSLRAYNRALTDAEIKLLAREFVFNSAPLAGRKGLLVPVGESVVAPPANGLIFYASLSEESSTAETGQALTKNGTITYETLVGIPCITKGNTSAYLSAPLSVEGVFTLSFWIKTTYTGEYIGMAYVGGLCIFDALSNSNFQFSAKKNSSERVNFTGIPKPLKWRDGAWHHIALSITSTESKLYCDGTLISTASGVNISTPSNAYIGWDNDGDNAAASYARWRIYNRALTDAEIQAVACEHNPSKKLFIPLQTAYGTPKVGQKGIIVRSSQVVRHATYSKSAEAMPSDGLVFYLPCDSDSYTTAQTGQTLSKSGTVTATTVNGIPCLEIKSGSYLSGTLDGFSGDVSMAMSFWFKRLYSSSSAYITAGRGNYSLSGGDEIWASIEPDHIETSCGSSGSDARRAGIYNATIGTGWHHGYFSYDATSKKFKTVLDGDTENAGYSAERSYNFSSGLTLCINSIARATYAVKGNANYSQIRIFNRALSDAEIKTLAGEYKQEEVKKMFIAVKEQSAIPEDGLVFYAPLVEEASTAATGQTLSKSGTVTYGTESGVPCACFNGNGYLYFNASGLVTMSSDWAISLWIRFNSFSGQVPTAFAIGSSHNVGTAIRVCYAGGSLCFEPVSSAPESNGIITTSLNVWYHICIVHSGSKTIMYSDGVQKSEKSFSYSFTPSSGDIGNSLSGNEYFNGWISSVRIYNRALSAEEISALANEYTPEA